MKMIVYYSGIGGGHGEYAEDCARCPIMLSYHTLMIHAGQRRRFARIIQQRETGDVIVYYSGDPENTGGWPAEVLSPGTHIMLSYARHVGKYESDQWRIVRMSNDAGVVESHFLDSGAFTLWSRADKWAKETGRSCWDFYDTDEHWQYLDDYAAFVKKYAAGIDYYANVDAIPNGELSYRNQKYLENEHGLTPVPVVHLEKDSVKWLKKYMEEGYDYIGLGGLAGKATRRARRNWLDACFNVACDNAQRLPKVKLHGFGITSYFMLLRYPWWSVDSVTWAKQGGFGCIFVPHKRDGVFDFWKAPYSIATSVESKRRKELGEHYLTLTEGQQRIVREWLDEIGVPLGKVDKNGEVVEFGVLTRHTERRAANLLFFERLRAWLPEWPWPFTAQTVEGFSWT